MPTNTNHGFLEPRQRVSLSEYARMIIESDLLDFIGEKPTYSGSINAIFLVFHDKAKHNEHSAAEYLSRRPSIHEKVAPRLQNEVVNLIEDDFVTVEKVYGGSASKYVKSVVEQYAEMSYIEREEAFFSDTVRQLKAAIRHKELLRIKIGDIALTVRPHRLGSDKLSSYNYLAGYIRNEEGEDTIGVVRISRIRSVINDGDDGSLTDYETDEINDAIKERDFPYLQFEPQEIIVRLTEDGKRMYSNLLQNRPIYVSSKGDAYTFFCSEAQAEFYFFKFGENAEIISPVALREKFLKMYKDAAKKYS